MQYIGHTMGVPGMAPAEAARLFHDLGLDGMELICQENTPFTPCVSDAEAAALAEQARAAGCPVVTLTPYPWEIASDEPEKAVAARELVQRVVDLAAVMGASFVRVYSGRPRDPDRPEPDAFERAMHALRACGAYAGKRNIVLLVENHPGTLTRTGAATRRLVDAVGLLNVRALYDPANVMHDTCEEWETTLNIQAQCIAYIHIKDFHVQGGQRKACCVGDGCVPWHAILERLRREEWDGPVCFEYEKRWYPDDLPDAAEGMRRSLEFVRQGFRG